MSHHNIRKIKLFKWEEDCDTLQLSSAPDSTETFDSIRVVITFFCTATKDVCATYSASSCWGSMNRKNCTIYCTGVQCNHEMYECAICCVAEQSVGQPRIRFPPGVAWHPFLGTRWIIYSDAYTHLRIRILSRRISTRWIVHWCTNCTCLKRTLQNNCFPANKISYCTWTYLVAV